MPLQQITGCWSLPQEASRAYAKFPPLVWRKPWVLLPWEGSSRHPPKYCPQILTTGSKPAPYPSQELHASLLFSQLHHKGNSTPMAPHPALPKVPLLIHCSSLALSCETPHHLSVSVQGLPQAPEKKRHESSMLLSCRLSLVHVHTVEVIPFCPCCWPWGVCWSQHPNSFA